MNHYQLLAVEKTSTIDEIRKAYKKLAVMYHPDKNTGTEEKFREVNEAYTVLSDEITRNEYDKKLAFSNTFKRWGAAFGKASVAENFSKKAKTEKKGDDINYYLSISVQESINGTTKIIKFMRMVSCAMCDGSGAETFKLCEKCNGKRQYRLPPYDGIDRIIPCETCNESGKCIDIVCKKCNGDGLIEKNDIATIEIPPNATDGDMLKCHNMGNFGLKGASCGDLLIKIVVKQETVYDSDINLNLNEDETQILK